jgi:hypothetical protein
MPSFLCVCGEPIRMSGTIPNPLEWRVIADEAAEEFVASDRFHDFLVASVPMFRCPRSDHLWVFWNGYDASATLYEPRDIPDVQNPSRPET